MTSPQPVLGQPMTVENAALEVRDIEKSFGAVKALEGVSFGVRAGEVMGLIGDNGAGKSTLINCLAGIIRPDAGRILLDGEEVTISSPHEARQLGIETVHQDLALIDTLDVSGNLFLNREILSGPRVLRWMNKRRMHREAKEILEGLRINIPSVRNAVEKLSGGQRQAVAVGRSVAWGRRIVLMDEPAAASGRRAGPSRSRADHNPPGSRPRGCADQPQHPGGARRLLPGRRAAPRPSCGRP